MDFELPEKVDMPLNNKQTDLRVIVSKHQYSSIKGFPWLKNYDF